MKTQLSINNEAVTLESVEKKPGAVRFVLNGKDYSFRCQRLPDGGLVLEEETATGVFWRATGAALPAGKGAFRVQLGALEAKVSPVMAVSGAAAASQLSPTAPMPGLIRQVLVKAGEQVKKGQALVVMEAMKLQTTLSAGGDATVEAVLVKPGDQVVEGAELVKLTAP